MLCYNLKTTTFIDFSSALLCAFCFALLRSLWNFKWRCWLPELLGWANFQTCFLILSSYWFVLLPGVGKYHMCLLLYFSLLMPQCLSHGQLWIPASLRNLSSFFLHLSIDTDVYFWSGIKHSLRPWWKTHLCIFTFVLMP